jgi:hypothetical protein
MRGPLPASAGQLGSKLLPARSCTCSGGDELPNAKESTMNLMRIRRMIYPKGQLEVAHE